MSTPAGWPWRVMMTSSLVARRRYLEKSSLTAERATSRDRRAFFVEPRVGLLLGDDGEDFDRCFRNVREHPDLSDSKSVLRLAQPTKALDTTLATLARRVAQMTCQCIFDPRPVISGKLPEALRGFRCQDDRETHFGQMIARPLNCSKSEDGRLARDVEKAAVVLAKALEGSAASAATDPSQSPTLTAAATQSGISATR